MVYLVPRINRQKDSSQRKVVVGSMLPHMRFSHLNNQTKGCECQTVKSIASNTPQVVPPGIISDNHITYAIVISEGSHCFKI